MRQIVVISGKGGTGKTSITASLAALAKPVVLADCDVDGPDLDLLADPVIKQRHPFRGGKKARIETEQCCACGRCAATCRFHAIQTAPGNDVVEMTYAVDPFACEGCGACTLVCPAQAIRFEPVTNGEWYLSQTRFGPMVHARLRPGEENSGKLVSEVRKQARQQARDHQLANVLIDGSPGVGCPVIASLTGADQALIVAEPTPSGRHDALRVMELAERMNVPAALCVNRWDLNPALADSLEAEAENCGVPSVGRVREDPAIVEAQMHNVAIVEFNCNGATKDIKEIWRRLDSLSSKADIEPAHSRSDPL